MTALKRRRLTALIAVIATALVGCSSTTSGVPARTSAPGPTTVNVSLLNSGRYPTTPQPPLGAAGSEQAGRLVEGRRMAGYVVGPWQADAALSARLSNDVAVIEDYKQLGSALLWAPIMAGAWSLPFVVGFVSQRHSAGTDAGKSLRNAVLRFADPGSASAAAQGFFAHAMDMPRTRDVTPIVTEPVRAVQIPGHPDTKAALLTFFEGNQSVQELTVAAGHGPYVLVQVVRCAAGPDCEAQLAARTLDLQVPLIDTFTATDSAQFATLPLDPTGLVARTLPLPADQATSTSGAAYDLAGALHFEDDPVKVGPALASAGVDSVAINLTTVYQTKSPAAARDLVPAYGDIVAKTPAAQGAPGVAGLPQSRCLRVASAGGLVPRYSCVAAAGRYVVKTIARQLDNAQQQVAAQYRMLTG